MNDLQEAWMGGVKQMAMALPPEVRWHPISWGSFHWKCGQQGSSCNLERVYAKACKHTCTRELS